MESSGETTGYLNLTRRFLPLLLIVLASCFPVDPVRERLEISFPGDGMASVKVQVSLAKNVQDGEVAERLAAVRQEYLRQTDPWSLRFQRVEPEGDRYTIERDEGVLVEVEREMLLPTNRVTDIFYDTGIQLHYRDEGGIAELAIYAGGSQRATREQQRLYRDLVEGWGDDYFAYLRAMERVYAYMDAQPERAARLFGELIGEERESGDEDDVTPEEQELLDYAQATMNKVISVFETGTTRAYSLEEISSLVNDPFPGAVTIHPAGKILEYEGFELEERGRLLRVPRVSLWSAVGSLRGQWLSPDPLVIVVDHGRDNSIALPSSESLAALPRFVSPPDEGRLVWEELRERMTVPATYRATWRVEADPRKNNS